LRTGGWLAVGKWSKENSLGGEKTYVESLKFFKNEWGDGRPFIP
jgi:hypothetical protein